MNQGIPLDRVECARNAAVFILLREIVDGKLQVNDDMCYGCGLCVSTCPAETTELGKI